MVVWGYGIFSISVQLDISLVHWVQIVLNTQREIPYFRAPMYSLHVRYPKNTRYDKFEDYHSSRTI